MAFLYTAILSTVLDRFYNRDELTLNSARNSVSKLETIFQAVCVTELEGNLNYACD